MINRQPLQKSINVKMKNAKYQNNASINNIQRKPSPKRRPNNNHNTSQVRSQYKSMNDPRSLKKQMNPQQNLHGSINKRIDNPSSMGNQIRGPKPVNRKRKTQNHRRKTPQKNTPYINNHQKHNQQMYSNQRPIQQRPNYPAKKPKRRMTRREYLMRKRRRKILLNTISCVLIMGLTSTFFYNKIKVYNETPRAEYTTGSKVIINQSKIWPSLIIKDEEVVTVAEASGFFKKIKDEGSTVNANDLVCITAKSSELFEKQKEKLMADSQMFLLGNRHSRFSYYLDELNSLDKDIYKNVHEFYQLEDKEAAASFLKYKLNNNIQLRTGIFLKQKSDLTKELVQERTFVVSEMSDERQQHLAPSAGIISYKVDGLEDDLVSEKLQEISYNDYIKYMKVTAKDITKQETQTLKNTPLFKVIKSNEWKAITYIEKVKANDLEINKEYELYAEEIPDKLFKVKLLTIENVDDDMYKLTLSGNDTEVLKHRTLTFTDKVESENGIKIPTSSLIKKDLLKIDENFVVEDDNGSFVIVKKEGVVNNQKINIIHRENGYVYINLKDLPINTELVTIDKLHSMTVTEIEELYFIILKGKEEKPIKVDIIDTNPQSTMIRWINELSSTNKVLTNPELLSN